MRAITGSWAIDEVEHAGGEHVDPGYVADYARKAGFDPTEDIESLRGRGLGARSTVVDMGCGVGTFALAVAPYCRRVVAVDVSGAMLSEVARGVEQGGIGHVEIVQGGFLSYEHSGAAADFVFTRNALHHLPDFGKALALLRLASMMAPTGVLWLRDLVYSCEPAEAPAMLERWFDEATTNPKIGYTREELNEHVRTEHSTFAWLLVPLIEHAGFHIAGSNSIPAARAPATSA